ncbi:MAG: hypothetical protein L0Z49_13990, partial [Actinobacteria bacterium]|nr:hypothetical protein [Actinomycetota bacterium]
MAGAPGFGFGSDFFGKVFVYSGVDGSVIHEVQGSLAGSPVGFATLLTGDLDGDGLSEFSTGSSYGPTFVYSGTDAHLVYSIPPPEGWATATWDPLAVLHVDADGIPDLALGSWWADPEIGGTPISGAGAVAAVSGADGSAFWTTPGAASYDRLGWSLANVGDVDQDGVDDLIAGAPGFIMGFEFLGSEAHQSYALVLSGATGAQLHRLQHDPPWVWPHTNHAFGWTVSGGDLDHDGTSELIVGHPIYYGDMGTTPRNLTVYAGPDGSLLHDSQNDDGSTVRVLGDVDGDGFDDILGCHVSNDCHGPKGECAGCGSCLVYSGEDYSEILQFCRDKSSPASAFGSYTAAAGDVDGDDFPDVV